MANSTSDQNEGHERRVENVLKRTRREVGLRDLLTMSFGRIWVVLLEFGAVLYALCGRRQDDDLGE